MFLKAPDSPAMNVPAPRAPTAPLRAPKSLPLPPLRSPRRLNPISIDDTEPSDDSLESLVQELREIDPGTKLDALRVHSLYTA